jgi:hypothetical protein
MPDPRPPWPARILAVVVSSTNHILAVRHKTARKDDKRVAMWSDPAQAADVLQHLGTEWRVIVSRKASPASLYNFLGSVAAEQIRGYILDPLEPLPTSYDLLAIPLLEDWRQFEPSALASDTATLADLQWIHGQQWEAITQSCVQRWNTIAQSCMETWDTVISSVLGQGLQELPTGLGNIDFDPPQTAPRQAPLQTVPRTTIIRLASQRDKDDGQVKIGPDSPGRKKEPDLEHTKPPDPDPTRLVEV